MFGKERCEAILKDVLLRLKAADEAQVTVFSSEAGLTRFACNYIHQNTFERDGKVMVRVVLGKRIGHASTNRVDEEGLNRLVERAFQIAKLSEEDPDFGGLPEPQSVSLIDSFRLSTERYTPEKKALAIGELIKKAKSKGFVASGAFETGLREIGIANSKGVFLYHPVTVADFSTVVMSDDSSGFANRSSIDVHDLDVPSLAQRAIEKTELSRHPIEVSPGDYPVVLEENAVETLVSFLGFIGFNGMAVREGRSFLVENQGSQVANPSINIWDNGSDRRGLVRPFDFEGVPKQRVELISKGVAVGAVWDSYNSRLAKVKNTGHALPSTSSYGPVPLNMFMGAGDCPKSDLAKGIKRGIWVTRFHYTNLLHQKKTLITGMTRDGTFLIENGVITRGVKNFRFTNSILSALNNVEALSTEATSFIDSWGSICVPAARLSSFTFSGKTDF
ncbi:TldD/PmbA family protein [bacterium]|nr:TldD/PmbA family protein [bacterium]